jgi:hypothetical protein
MAAARKKACFHMQLSGKLVIIGILAVAFSAAAASWWFRYAATHQAAEYWGPEAAKLIRDAPIVEFFRLNPPPDSTFFASEFSGRYARVDPNDIRDIATARGLVHLRNALLEDRSYNWPPRPSAFDTRWAWVLNFRDKARNDGARDNAHNDGAWLLFSTDCRSVAMLDRPNAVLSCQPIAEGLTRFFVELAPQTAESPR